MYATLSMFVVKNRSLAIFKHNFTVSEREPVFVQPDSEAAFLGSRIRHLLHVTENK